MAQVVDTSDFYNGLKFKWQDSVWEVLDFQHHKMGRGGATVKTKVKNLFTGSIVETSFRSGERFERIIFDEKPAQYLYQEGDGYVFMDLDSYDQISLSKAILGDAVLFLKDNLDVNLEMYEGKVMTIELPKSVELKVVRTDPGFKGDTVSGSGKPAILETGLTISVPMFINEGEVVVVDTRTSQYIERAKK
ncbi:elongation factor P [Aminiphilus circumscriptus]|jgi:elongation factor P|uniref:elongation factor P n=1 Tax=Aminiphilus circumscriptus TaxID=290732 RepID=UPI000492B153|nr:elongation factor P [Aminiphilus circumscriptus]